MFRRSWLGLGIVSLGVLAIGCCVARSNKPVDNAAQPLKSATQYTVVQPNAATVITTSPTAAFVRSTAPSVATNAAPDFVVLTTATLQAMTGFGGAFNEQGWEALSVLNPADREAVLKALFDPTDGLRFNWGRVPVGASDYAMDRYTLDETPGDFSMQHFSIARDQQRLIPYILAAQKFRADLRLWASAWTPPTWMKTNGAFDGGAMKDDPQVYAAYALYLTKFVQSYGSLGMSVQMVVPQNEPAQLTHYPSCDWKPQQYSEFISRHLAPTFRAHGIKASIFVGTINRPDWDVLSVLADPGTRAHVDGVALQWLALAQVAKIHAQHPDLTLMQSETECGNNHWEPGFNPDKAQNDFNYAMYTWRKFRDFIRDGSSSYMLWNMVLDERGKNIDSVRPWPQNSAIVINRAQKSVTYTPMYWATKHYSGLVDQGAHLVRTSGSFADGIAFVNPGGNTVVELLNARTVPTTLTLKLDNRLFAVELPATSFVSVIVPKS